MSKEKSKENIYRQAVIDIFEQFDRRKAGMLDRKDIGEVIDCVLCAVGDSRRITEEDVKLVMGKFDAKKDLQINKD